MRERRGSHIALRLGLLGAALFLALADAGAQFPGLDKVLKVAEAQREWSLVEEQSIGEAATAKMVAVLGLYENPEMVKYVNLVGQAVAQFAPRRDLSYRFGILDTEIVNAFACPGGYILVTRGLLANLQNEAELAGVLGHEIIHTAERHLEKELRNRKLAALGYQEGTAQIPMAELTELANRAVDQLLTGKLSRDKEYEADKKGVELAAAVGYDPSAYGEFLSWLDAAGKQGENRRALGILTASHPSHADRVARLQKQIKKEGWDAGERARLAERYQESVDFTPPPPEVPSEAATAVTEVAAGAAASAEAALAPAEEPGQAAEAMAEAAAAPTESATAAAAGGADWTFEFQPFAADMVTTHQGQQQRAKLYARRHAFRMEPEAREETSIIILRFDRDLSWILIPSQRMYMESSLKQAREMMPAAAMQEPDAKVEREFLGPKPAGGYNCLKYRVRVTSADGRTHTVLQWVAPELGGFAVKMVDEQSGAVVEYQNVVLGPPDASLFEVPPGYTKLAMPGLR
jgi:Zn-dependent protease with chaperone function